MEKRALLGGCGLLLAGVVGGVMNAEVPGVEKLGCRG
jgi:hypothetical protein